MTGTAQAAKAAFIRFPNDFGRTANDFDVAKVALTSTHSQYRLPATWSGRIVHVYSDTAAAVPQVALSKTTGGQVDTGAAASNTSSGAISSMAGGIIPTQMLVPMQLPKWDKQETVYLIGESAVGTTLYIWPADGV